MSTKENGTGTCQHTNKLKIMVLCIDCHSEPLPHLLLLEASDNPLTGHPKDFVELLSPLEVVVIGREDAVVELLPADK